AARRLHEARAGLILAKSQVPARLDELCIQLPPVAAAVASYVPAVRCGDDVYPSGQQPFVHVQLPKLGAAGESGTRTCARVRPEEAYELARIAVLNAVAAAAAEVGLENIERIVKVTGYVASATGFGGQPGVVNGASDILGEIFGEAGQH